MDYPIFLVVSLAAILVVALLWKLWRLWQIRKRICDYEALPLASDGEEVHVDRVDSHEGLYPSLGIISEDSAGGEHDSAEDPVLKNLSVRMLSRGEGPTRMQSEQDPTLSICSTLVFGISTLAWLVALLLCKTMTWQMLLMAIPGYFYGTFVALCGEWSHKPMDLFIGIVSTALFIWYLALLFEGMPWYLSLQGVSARMVQHWHGQL